MSSGKNTEWSGNYKRKNRNLIFVVCIMQDVVIYIRVDF